MIMDIECRNCFGAGRLHSAGCNGDPDDDGVPCEACDGTGTEQVDLNDEGDI